ncbi:MAG: hypothetical protein ACO38A_05305 [Ilumatobacteraceae bacterium]
MGTYHLDRVDVVEQFNTVVDGHGEQVGDQGGLIHEDGLVNVL